MQNFNKVRVFSVRNCIDIVYHSTFVSVQAAKIVKQVFSVLPVYEKIVPALLTDGVWNLSNTCSFTPGIPIGPMLAKPTKGVSEIVNKFQDMEFTCEYKYDGERAQVIPSYATFGFFLLSWWILSD